MFSFYAMAKDIVFVSFTEEVRIVYPNIIYQYLKNGSPIFLKMRSSIVSGGQREFSGYLYFDYEGKPYILTQGGLRLYINRGDILNYNRNSMFKDEF